jgi:hypothetical protein
MDPDGDLVTFEWDLDLDGEFDDASGVAAIVPFDEPKRSLIALRITDAGGRRDIALTRLAVTAVNGPPSIDAFQPGSTHPAASSGSPLDFSVVASDPENDPLSYEWTLDGAVVSSEATWRFTPAAGESGTRFVQLRVSDGDPFNLDAFEQRVVRVGVAAVPASSSLGHLLLILGIFLGVLWTSRPSRGEFQQ